MKVFLTTAYKYNPDYNFATSYITESAAVDPFKVHHLVADPKDADLIIFTEHHPSSDPYFFEIFKNNIYKTYKHKCYLYHDSDNTISLIPNATPSLELSHFSEIFNQPFSYIIQMSPNAFIKQKAVTNEKEYLFSFVGASRTHPIRKKIFNIQSSDSYLLDTSKQNSWELPENEKHQYQVNYSNICYKSKFILCPRGVGPNSYRLYESLEMGIVPVIVSDEWVPTVGPQWEDFSIRIAESEIDKIPEILKRHEDRALAMGLKARQAWEDWFCKDKQFHFLVEACVRLHNTRNKITFFTYLKQYLRFFEPFHFRNIMRYFFKRIK